MEEVTKEPGAVSEVKPKSKLRKKKNAPKDLENELERNLPIAEQKKKKTKSKSNKK